MVVRVGRGGDIRDVALRRRRAETEWKPAYDAGSEIDLQEPESEAQKAMISYEQ